MLPVSTHEVAGLEDPAEIRIDRWGVAHINAVSEDDLFVAQGFNAARDRLWQLEIWRRRGLGTLAEVFGPGYAAQDHAARSMLYVRPMAEEWSAYKGIDAERVCTHFAMGINEFIRLAISNDGLLPPEFTVFDFRPTYWRPEDVVRIRSHARVRNASEEALRSRCHDERSLEIDSFRRNLTEDGFAQALKEALKLPHQIPEATLNTLKLSSYEVTFDKRRLDATIDEIPNWREPWIRDEENKHRNEPEGSNNWAIHGDVTVTGKPILASDPHRVFQVPSLRYLVHLKCQTINVIGAGEPCIPGISIGHNEHIGFGLTIFPCDQEDLYLFDLETDPATGEWYFEAGDQRIVIHSRLETIGIKGGLEWRESCWYSDLGPIVHVDFEKRIGVGLQTVAQEPGAAPYFASLCFQKSKNIEQFKSALENWKLPSANFVYADTLGNIARCYAGRFPIRTSSGLVPVNGERDVRWTNMLDSSDLPYIENPRSGFVFSANENNLRASQNPFGAELGFEWDDPFRAMRIDHALGKRRVHDMGSSLELQTDCYSLVAAKVIAFVGRRDNQLSAGRFLSLFAGWDFVAHKESKPAVLFEMWWNGQFKNELLSSMYGDAARSLSSVKIMDGKMVGLLESGIWRRHFSNQELSGLIEETMEKTLRLVTNGTCQWADVPAWGNLHLLELKHPAHELFPLHGFDVRTLFKIRSGGTDTTVKSACYDNQSVRISNGASFRMVVDFSDFDNSVAINLPGQSGDPRSAFFSNLIGHWENDAYFPLCFSAGSISENTVETIELLPV